MSEKNPVAIVHKVCPVCGKQDDEQSELLIHKRFGDLSKVNNKAIGYGTFCKTCKEGAEKAVFMVVCDLTKSEDHQNPYRTGEVFGMSEDWVTRVITPEDLRDHMLKVRMSFIDYKDAKTIGLPTKYEP